MRDVLSLLSRLASLCLVLLTAACSEDGGRVGDDLSPNENSSTPVPGNGPRDAGRDASRAPGSSAPDSGAVGNAGKSDAGKSDGSGDAGSDASIGDEPDDAPIVQAPWLVESGDAVFFVGNSFFNYDDHILPDWVRAVGEAVTPKIVIETGSHIVPGNHPLSWFFDQSDSQDAIASKKYKLFILQGEEFEPVDDKAGFHAAVRDYHAAVTKQGGSLMLFMTWDFKWNEGDDSAFLNKLAAAYDEIGEELDIPVIPVGLIYDDVNKSLPPGEQAYFLNGGDLHQTEKGSAVNAYATFSMLTGVDPHGVPFSAYGNTNSPTLLQYLSDKSWARVEPRLSP